MIETVKLDAWRCKPAFVYTQCVHHKKTIFFSQAIDAITQPWDFLFWTFKFQVKICSELTLNTSIACGEIILDQTLNSQDWYWDQFLTNSKENWTFGQVLIWVSWYTALTSYIHMFLLRKNKVTKEWCNEFCWI